MNIVFVGNFNVDYSSENHHKKSLEALGHNVIALQEGQVRGEEILEQALDADLLVFVHTHGWVTPGLELETVLRILKKNNVQTMTYHLDLWLGLKREQDLHNDPFYKQIGHFFATDKLMADWFNENTEVKGHFIPAGVFHEEVYLASDDSDEGNDVIFVGSKGYHPEWTYRPQLIDWLRSTYGSRFTHVGGDGDTGTIRGARLNKIYAASKVAVGDTLCLNFNYPYYVSDRLFESVGRGGFTIFPYIKGIEEWFELGKELIVYEYGDFHNLKKLIDYYCEHDDERIEIRNKGHERVLKEHTYKQRWQQIIKELGLEPRYPEEITFKEIRKSDD